jgi:aryl-alcohol dehydrogenase-like predicted oxidoreductase
MSATKNLGFGCVSLTQHTFLKDAQRILSIAYDEGIKHYDTALLYGNGYSERILGTFIKNKRDKVTITTKCGLGNVQQPVLNIKIALPLNAIKKKIKKPATYSRMIQPEVTEYRLISLEYVQLSLKKSLDNLKTDHIDHYLLHEAMPSFLSEDAFLFLMQQKEKGVIRELGVAAAFVNLYHINSNDLNGFEILQYENGLHYSSDELLTKFPEKKHFYHSTLKSLPFLKSTYSPSEMAGILLNIGCKTNPSGKVLFSTTNINRLQQNVKCFHQFNEMPLYELNKLYSAIHRS